MANDGAVVIDVLLDSAKAMTEYNKLGSVMSGTGSKIGSALKAGTAAAIAGTAAVGVAAVGIGKQVLASYADYEQLVGGVDTLLAMLLRQYKDLLIMHIKQQGCQLMPTWKL
ncbi:hypothetical protein L3H36_06225 [Lactococcus lactis]